MNKFVFVPPPHQHPHPPKKPNSRLISMHFVWPQKSKLRAKLLLFLVNTHTKGEVFSILGAVHYKKNSKIKNARYYSFQQHNNQGQGHPWRRLRVSMRYRFHCISFAIGFEELNKWSSPGKLVESRQQLDPSHHAIVWFTWHKVEHTSTQLILHCFLSHKLRFFFAYYHLFSQSWHFHVFFRNSWPVKSFRFVRFSICELMFFGSTLAI